MSGLLRTTPASKVTVISDDSNPCGYRNAVLRGNVLSVFGLTACLSAFIFLTSCATSNSSSSNNSGRLVVSPRNGSLQNAVVGAAFAQPLVAVATRGGVPTTGVAVTFTAPSSGASGTFANGMVTETDTTDSTGLATSSKFTANATTGTFTVSATASGASAPANFSLTNNPIAPAGIFATAGIIQRAQTGAGFGKMVATVMDGNGHPMSGVSVTFSAPSSPASGTFGSGNNTENVTSDTNGLATSSDFTANATAGQYNVTASVTANGTLTPATFILTNVQSGITLTSYSFYLTGQSQSHASVGHPGINFYSLAGAITVDQNGNVTGGEEDYNDANGYTFPGVAIKSGTLVITNSTTGQGTLTLNTSNLSLGNAGAETFAVQFVNTAHAMIIQWDGSATSSGSMDIQNLSSAPSGGYAFTLSGVDPAPIAFGGVLASSGNLLNPNWAGTIDINDTNQSVSTGNPLVATVSAMDVYGRGQITGISVLGIPLTIEYYLVGPEALRLIDVDTGISAIGSAFGRGTNATGATLSALGNSVFAVAGNPYSSDFGAVGQFITDGSGNLVSGVADDHEFGNGVSATAASVTGKYSTAANGYGTLTFTPGLGNVSKLGLYLTDPNLNLNDPNNSTGGGGALLLDLDTGLTASASLAGGTGIITPQTDTSATNFAGNYAANWQAFHNSGCNECEFDMLAQGSMTASGPLSLTGMVSDPFQTLTTTPATSGDTFGSTPLADATNLGRYTMLSTNTNPNPLEMMITTPPRFYASFDVVLYQASGTQLFWMEVDSRGVFVGPLEQQGSLTGIPAMRKHLTEKDLTHPAEARQKTWTKRIYAATPDN